MANFQLSLSEGGDNANAETGFDKIVKRLNEEIQKIDGRTEVGLREAANLIKTISMTKTPVEFGFLRARHYVNSGKIGGNFIVEVGNTAEYAPPVHERLDARHETGEAKFLENAIKQNAQSVVKIVKDNVKI